MTVNVQFHFDFGSPNAYLSHLVIPAIQERTGVTFDYVPVLLGGVFKATNNMSPAQSLQGIRNKGEYQALVTQRFIKAHGIARYERNPHFPVNTLMIMRGAVYARARDATDPGFYRLYIDQVYRHMWAEPKKMDDPEIVMAALTDSGLPAADIASAIATVDIKQQLIANTDDAVQRGVFGSPSFFVDDELYFGKDTLAEVEQAILNKPAP